MVQNYRPLVYKNSPNYNMYFLVCGTFAGLFFHVLQTYIGMKTLDEAVYYYAEVHLSYWNSLFHTFFMPITMYGMFTWIPALLNLKPKHAHYIRIFIASLYIFHYARIRVDIAFYIVIIYSYPFLRSYKDYSKTYRLVNSKEVKYVLIKSNKYNFIRGFVCSFVALGIQEYFGHYIGGDDASRVEAIPNAIIYAPYYSVEHLFNYEKGVVDSLSIFLIFIALLVFIEYFDKLLNKYFRDILLCY